MVVEALEDYGAAFEIYDQKVLQNSKALTKILGNTSDHISETGQHEIDMINKIGGMMNKIEGIMIIIIAYL